MLPCSFLINNYNYVHEQLSSRNLQADDRDTFLSLLEEQKQLFVEEELSESFGRLLEFVPRAEAQLGIQLDSGDGDGDEDSSCGGSETANQGRNVRAVESVDKSKIESLVRHFGSTWKAGISHGQVNQHVFPGPQNGMSILKLCLTQLLLYHTRFQEIIDRVFKNKPVPLRRSVCPSKAFSSRSASTLSRKTLPLLGREGLAMSLPPVFSS